MRERPRLRFAGARQCMRHAEDGAEEFERSLDNRRRLWLACAAAGRQTGWPIGARLPQPAAANTRALAPAPLALDMQARPFFNLLAHAVR